MHLVISQQAILLLAMKYYGRQKFKTLPMAIARHQNHEIWFADKKAFELFNMSVTDILAIMNNSMSADFLMMLVI